MNLRVLSGAFIIRENEFLMMKRSEHRKLAPGMWAGVGGHSEPHEINNPKATCLREIFEETDLAEKDLEKLDLKYIILRKTKEEITLMYYFVGSAFGKSFVDKTLEGKLYWVDKSELLDRPMSFEIKKILEHYLTIGFENNEVHVGTISAIDHKPIINWNVLNGWEGLI